MLVEHPPHDLMTMLEGRRVVLAHAGAGNADGGVELEVGPLETRGDHGGDRKALAKACGQTPLQLSAVANVGMTSTLRALRDSIVDAKKSGSDD